MTVPNLKDVQETCHAPQRHWKFADILADPSIHARWEKVRRYFFLRESTYDMSCRCNIRCEGCYYFEGAKQYTTENRDPEAWRQLMQVEKARGVTFVVLAGAEPALVPELCRVCYEEMPLGTIATNGLIPIPEAIGYRIHISVWGNDATSRNSRCAADILARQIENYRNGPRAVFVYTFTPTNIDEAREVAEILSDQGAKVTFNMFSAPVGYDGPLKHTPASLAKVRETMIDLLASYPEQVLFSNYSAVVHTHHLGLDAVIARNILVLPGHQAAEAVPVARYVRILVVERGVFEVDRAAVERAAPGVTITAAGPLLPIAPGMHGASLRRDFPTVPLTTVADGVARTIAFYREEK